MRVVPSASVAPLSVDLFVRSGLVVAFEDHAHDPDIEDREPAELDGDALSSTKCLGVGRGA